MALLPSSTCVQTRASWRASIVPSGADAVADDEVLDAWTSLPRRIYVDTSTVQKLHDFGGEVFEGEPFVPVGRAARVQGLAGELDALRMIVTAC
jgi:hypothetical protein